MNGVSWGSQAYVDNFATFGRSGSRSIRFRQDGGTWAEIRFIGMAQLAEVFLEWWLYMPDGTESPSLGIAVAQPGRSNDKFYRLWSGNYGTGGIKYGASSWFGAVGIEYVRNAGDSQWGMGEGGEPLPPDQARYESFVGSPTYLGRWVRIRVRNRVASAANNDGIIQMWFDHKLVQHRVKLPSYGLNGTKNYFEEGYLLGWANNGFPAGQFMYIDDFKISTGGFMP